MSPWTIQIHVNLKISEYKEENTNPITYKNRFHDKIQK